jgi:hypothetical protein
MVGGMLAHTIGSFELKVSVTVLCGFLNSPIARASIKVLFFFLTLAVKTVGLWQQ